ncbi:MAG: NHL repeat-containing protein [Saccharofermentanales bacterium]
MSTEPEISIRKGKNELKKGTMRIMIVILMVSLLAQPSYAVKPYYNYTYDFNGQIQQESQAYTPYGIIDGESMNTTDLNSPQDVFVSGKNNVYICDTGNNRIIILDKDLKLTKIITGYMYKGKTVNLNNPQGVYVTPDDMVYIADSGNKRIVVFDTAWNAVKIIEKPKSALLSAKYSFVPLKIAVDSYKRIFVVVENESNGIIQLDQNGAFLGYYGAIAAPANFFRKIFMVFSSKEQKENMIKNIPTVYSNIALDDADFVYGTVGSIDIKFILDNSFTTMFVHKLNPLGQDILKRYGNVAPMGDAQFMTDYTAAAATPLPSLLTDIAVRDGGIYSVLDRRMGRIFTYDNDGNLLYIFGGIGNQLGQFSIPVALDTIYDDHYIVLDSKYNQLVLFKPTEYAKLVTTPLIKYYNHEYDEVLEFWQDSLKYTAKSELVYEGMSKALYQMKNYREAMKYAKLANDRKQYSFAYQAYRKEVLQIYFGPALTALLILMALLIILRKVILKTGKREKAK